MNALSVPGRRRGRRGAPARAATALGITALAAVALTTTVPASATPSAPRVVASGLDNPRGITVAADGRVFVAEAGTGAAGSGRITVIARGHARTFASGLPSAQASEGDVTGPTDVSVSSTGAVFATVGVGPQVLDPRFNSVLRVRSGATATLADIQAYVNGHPDPTDLDQPPNPTDSNPYSVLRIDGRRTLVADAANNSLLMVGPNGTVRTLATFPNEVVSTAHLPFPFPAPAVPAEAVPTSVTVGPDGYAYVGELKGFPFTPGTSRVWRVSLSAHDATCDPTATSGPCRLFLDGLTSITGLDFGPDGSLYVVSMVKNGLFGFVGGGGDTTGALYRVKHGVVTELAPGALTLPGGVAVGCDGTVYVTNNSVSTGGGQVLAIKP